VADVNPKQQPRVVGDLPGAPPARPRGKTTVTSIKARGVVSQPEDRTRTRTHEGPFLQERTIMKVLNIDNVSWEFFWARTRYLVRPGETGLVPFPAVVLKMGDPRSAADVVTRFTTEEGMEGIIPTRFDSLVTLFAHYGIENFEIGTLVDFAPKLEIRTMEEDLLVTFPAQDPEGPPWPVPHTMAPGRENSDMRRVMEQTSQENKVMREELTELRRLVSDRLGGEPPQEVADETDDDIAQALMGGASIDQGPVGTFE
jgi:hypothetical protein